MVIKVLMGILGVFLVVVLAIVGLAFTKPDNLHVERSMTIKASPETIYPNIINLKAWQGWSPWEEKDPNMKKTYSGPESGVGASQDWNGNEDVGAGKMEITEAKAPEKVVIGLHFSEPFEGDSTATFTLVPESESTKVTWAMDSSNNFMSKLMQVFMDMDEMCGKDFERGLTKLKEKVESNAVPTSDTNSGEVKSETEEKVEAVK